MKRHHFTALVSILREAGLRSRTANRIEALIEGDSYLGLTGDDVAGALLRWCNAEADRIYAGLERFHQAELHHPDIPGQEVLFD